MRHPSRPESRPGRRAAVELAALLVLVLAAAPAAASTEGRFLFKGLFDTEAHATDTDSVLLARNDGRPIADGRLTLWQGLALTSRFSLVASERMSVAAEGDSAGDLEMGFLRWSPPSPIGLEIDAGRILTPVGSFAGRHYSDRNPLIGSPDSYGVSYPVGAQIAGVVSWFDFRVAAIDRPVVNEGYMPGADRSVRPAAGFGITPATGVRFGAYFTRGPYLGAEVDPLLPAGAVRETFEQRLLGFELQLRRGYTEVNAEWTISSYEAPTAATTLHGSDVWAEVRRTWTPRLFTAVRLEKNDYPFVLPINPYYWVAKSVNFYNGEAGVGYRIGPETIIKLSYRRDLWTVEDDLRTTLPDGWAIGVQLSRRFDVIGLLDRPR